MKSSYSLLLTLGHIITTANLVLASNGLVPQKYFTLPMGDVKPSGWLLEKLRAPDRLSLGKDVGFYQYLAHANTEWTPRTMYTYNIEGAGSHWFNDMVTVGAVLDIPVIKSQTEQFLDYFLDTQGEDGWLGPEVNTTKARQVSASLGSLPFLCGAIRVAEAQPARAGRITNALHKFAGHVYETLQRGDSLLDNDGAYTGDLLVVLQWLYDVYPDGREAALLETMRMLAGPAEDALAHVFRDENIPEASSDGVGMLPDVGTMWRGMSTAKTMTTLGAKFRLSGEQSRNDTLGDSWDALFEKYGEPSGLLLPDSRELWFTRGRGHVATETMRSALYLYRVTGEPKYAEQADRILYNARATSHAYGFSAFGWGTVCDVSLCRGSYSVDGPYYDLFHRPERHGRDPSCCTIRYPEGPLDYVHASFLVTADRTSLVQAHLGPFTVNTTLAGDNQVAVIVETAYPYSSNTALTTTIVAQKAFAYYVRIPTWSDGAAISFADGRTEACKPVAGLHAIQIPAGTTRFVLALHLPITADRRPSGLVTVYRGPLLFVFDRLQQSGGEEPHRNVRYAIDPSTLALSTFRPQPMFHNLWTDYTISVAACPVSQAGHSFLDAPESEPDTLTCIGPVMNLTLTPYPTSTFPFDTLREFPTFDLAEVGGTVSM